LELAKDDARILGSADDLQIISEQTSNALALLAKFVLLFLLLEDQNGVEINLPKDEQNSLIIAMSLHEKGRAALTKRNFDLALVSWTYKL
jgi:hypothetical protein